MAIEKIDGGIFQPSSYGAAFGGSGFQQKFRAENDDHGAAPICDRIAVERTDVRGRIGAGVKDNPEREQHHADDGK